MDLDAENGDILWQDAINKEMSNHRIAFEILEEVESAPVGYTKITCHLILRKDGPYKESKVCFRETPNRPPIIYDIR